MEDREIKRRIVKSASELFFYHGFSKVTLDEVAEKIGISKKTIYNHYDGKREVLRAVIRTYQEDMEAVIADAMKADSSDFVAKFKNNLTAIAVELSVLTPHFCEDMSKNAVDIWEEFLEFKRAVVINHFFKLIDLGIKNGSVTKKINKELSVLMYLTATENLISTKYIKSLPKETSAKIPASNIESFNGMIDVLYFGILSDDAKSKSKK
ncbi:MAG: TetR/AcrR family transcriptional regulator [Bacteroidota bacterium]